MLFKRRRVRRRELYPRFRGLSSSGAGSDLMGVLSLPNTNKLADRTYGQLVMLCAISIRSAFAFGEAAIAARQRSVEPCSQSGARNDQDQHDDYRPNQPVLRSVGRPVVTLWIGNLPCRFPRASGCLVVVWDRRCSSAFFIRSKRGSAGVEPWNFVPSAARVDFLVEPSASSGALFRKFRRRFRHRASLRYLLTRQAAHRRAAPARVDAMV